MRYIVLLLLKRFLRKNVAYRYLIDLCESLYTQKQWTSRGCMTETTKFKWFNHSFWLIGDKTATEIEFINGKVWELRIFESIYKQHCFASLKGNVMEKYLIRYFAKVVFNNEHNNEKKAAKMRLAEQRATEKTKVREENEKSLAERKKFFLQMKGFNDL